MLELIRHWVLGLAGAALCCAVLTEITPAGSVKKVVKALCGVIMALALIDPLLTTDAQKYSLNLSKYRQSAENVSRQGKEISDRLNRTIIEEECRTYILDKAMSMGAELEDAAVTLKWSSEGLWYPVGCTLKGEYSDALAAAIEAELGIPGNAQEWVSNENA